MSDPNKALATQLANIQTRTGKSLDDFRSIIRESGLSKHSEVRAMIKEKFELGYGDANTIAHLALQEPLAQSGTANGESVDQALDRIYAGAKAALRPIHDALMARLQGFGEFEIAPKKTYLSLRRKKQFATIGPASSKRFVVGLNPKGFAATERLLEMPANSMCKYGVNLTNAADVDDELTAWLRSSFDDAG